MSFSTLTTNMYRLVVGSILVMLLVIGMILPAWATNTTATRGIEMIAPGASASVVVKLSDVDVLPGQRPGPGQNPVSAPGDPGCQGANANSAICQNSSGGAG